MEHDEVHVSDYEGPGQSADVKARYRELRIWKQAFLAALAGSASVGHAANHIVDHAASIADLAVDAINAAREYILA